MIKIDQLTPLHYCALNNSYELIIFFVGKSIEILWETTRGLNCFHISAFAGHSNLCKTLTNDYNINIHLIDNDKFFLLRYYVLSGSYKLVTFYVHKGTCILLKAKYGWNCLHLAALAGYLNLSKTLVNGHKIKVSLIDSDGFTPHRYSVQNDNYELVKFFVDKGGDILAKTKTEIHIATINEPLKPCKTLVNKYEFDVHAADNCEYTALQFSSRNGNYELITFFVDKMFNILLKNLFG